MEALLALAVACVSLVLVGWGVRRFFSSSGVSVAARNWQAARVTRRAAIARDAEQRQAARAMQVAILQLDSAPDFRRAAAFAAQAARVGVPTDFRQRQFRRLRERLVAHLARRRDGDVSVAAGLRELVTALGVAAYEAEYITAEARQRRETGPDGQPASYRDRLQNLHADHRQRLEAIRSTADLDPELREQLQEAEQERFRAALLDAPERS